ncbi:hypothetical protein NDU88_010670 [Pleurodeles waltl]|uniref:Uncharacterized protein n=1 Tax=Pleurodeles waltl TaxID=8319 RepID=A0AAV7QYL2_PLEWA|nr:hypothetical protein NDU88_010670 [Pleurodeles waltl]
MEPLTPVDLVKMTATISTAYTDTKLDKILETIAETIKELCSRVDVVAVEIGLLQEDHCKLTSQVTITETTPSELCPCHLNLERTIRSLTAKVQERERTAEDLEVCSCCKNIRIVLFSERAEDSELL